MTEYYKGVKLLYSQGMKMPRGAENECQFVDGFI